MPSSAVNPATVATVLNQLSTKSLVLIEILNEQRRYRLLEPIRQFAHSQLVASGEQENINRRHAFYFLALAQQMAAARDTLEERAWLQRLEPERNNLRTVNSWAVSQNEAEFAQRFNGLLYPFWLYCSSANEARHWSEAVLALTTTESTPAARQAKAMALDVAGYAAISQGDYVRALDYFGGELPLYAENDDPRGIATSLRGCGFAAMQSGDLVQAQHYTAESLVVSQKAQDHWGTAWSLFDLGYLALVRHELSQAQSLLEVAVVAFREQGNAFGLYRALFALARVSGKNGDTAQARTLCHDALRVQQQMHYLLSTTEGLEDLAGIEAREQQPVRAARIFGAAQAHHEAMGTRRYRHRDVWFEHDLALARSQLDSNAWDVAWAEGAAMTLEQAVEYALAG